MPTTQRSARVEVELDGIVDLAELEAAALDFARRGPGELAAAVKTLTVELFDAVIGPFGFPLADAEQPEASWSCTGCGSSCGFRRRGQRRGGRSVTTAAGRVRMEAWQVACRSCGRPSCRSSSCSASAPISAAPRRSASWQQAWRSRSPTRKRRGFWASSPASRSPLARSAVTPSPWPPERLGPEDSSVPVLVLDGTGVRAGDKKLGVELHLAVGVVARCRESGRVVVGARLLGATLGEACSAMAELLGEVRPGLVIVDGVEAITDLVEAVFGSRTPIQRCEVPPRVPDTVDGPLLGPSPRRGRRRAPRAPARIAPRRLRDRRPRGR